MGAVHHSGVWILSGDGELRCWLKTWAFVAAVGACASRRPSSVRRVVDVRVQAVIVLVTVMVARVDQRGNLRASLDQR